MARGKNAKRNRAQEVRKTLEISHLSVKAANFASLAFKGFKDFANALAQRPCNNLRRGLETSLGDLNAPSHTLTPQLLNLHVGALKTIGGKSVVLTPASEKRKIQSKRCLNLVPLIIESRGNLPK